MLVPDRANFFNALRGRYGRLSQDLVTALDYLLDRMQQDPRWHRLSYAAYMLATIEHETARTFLPINEYGGAAYFDRRYGPQTSVGRRLGNTQPGDGDRYHGRGYVQITGRSNYKHLGLLLSIDLEGDPTLALKPAVAYDIMVEGMTRGLFTGKKFMDYLNSTPPDYHEARRIINGLDQAKPIAAYARFYEAALVPLL